MQNLLKILLRYSNFLVFIILEVAAFMLFSYNNAYPRSSILSTSNDFVAWQHEQMAEITNYFRLRSVNEELAAENAALRNQICSMDSAKNRDVIHYESAKVVHMTTDQLHNYLTINRGSVDGISIGLCGDLKNGRTVHSLIKALAKFNDIKFYLISPRELALPEYMRIFMRENGMRFTEVTNMEPVIPMLDVLYMTRIQRERFIDPLEYERNKGVYILSRRKLARAKPKLMVLHPLPRVDEIDVDVDDDPRAAYFEQARFGMYARMALLMDLANQGHKKPEPVEICTNPVCSNPNCITQTEGSYLPALTKVIGGMECCAYCDKELR